MEALAKFNSAHLSINACTVSPLTTPASTALSSKEKAAYSFAFAKSLLLVGAMTRSVKGTIAGMIAAARTLSLKGTEVVFSGIELVCA